MTWNEIASTEGMDALEALANSKILLSIFIVLFLALFIAFFLLCFDEQHKKRKKDEQNTKKINIKTS